MSEEKASPLWQTPTHHEDMEAGHDHVHWIELFYDLIQVVSIFMLGNYLSHNLTVEGVFIFTVLFSAVWFAWADSSVFNSIYVSSDIWHRVLMALQTVSTMFMAASIATIDTHFGQSMFALAYAANRAINAMHYLRIIVHDAESTSLAWEMVRTFSIQSFFFAMCSLLPYPYNVGGFIFVLSVAQLSYFLPTIGVMRHDRIRPRLGHISERFALLMLIVLGEGFFKLVTTLSDRLTEHLSDVIYYDAFVSFAFGGLAIFLLCWLYFDTIGNNKVKNSKSSTLRRYWFIHFLLMYSALLFAVALSSTVKFSFMESYALKYATLGTVGLTLFFVTLGLLQSLTERKPVDNFASWDIKIFGIVLIIGTWFLSEDIPKILANIVWIIALVAQIAVPIRRAKRYRYQHHDTV